MVNMLHPEPSWAHSQGKAVRHDSLASCWVVGVGVVQVVVAESVVPVDVEQFDEVLQKTIRHAKDMPGLQVRHPAPTLRPAP